MLTKLFDIKSMFVPNSSEMALSDLEEAKKQMLAHKSQAEYHTKMAEFYMNKINRLTDYVNRNPL